MAEPLKHAKGPWERSLAECRRVYQLADVEIVTESHGIVASIYAENWPNGQDFGNSTLLALAPHAPHLCADPACPGNVNRLKLAAWEKVVEALKAARSFMPYVPLRAADGVATAECQVDAALALAEAAERGEG